LGDKRSAEGGLVFNLCDDEIRIYDPAHHDRCTRFSGAVVSSAYSTFFVIDPLQHTSIIGVHFRPGGAFASGVGALSARG
jgi:hypothetical protein